MKKQIRVPVGTTPKIETYYRSSDRYIHYAGSRIRLYPESPIDELVRTLTSYITEYGNQYTNLKFSEVRDCGCYHMCDCNPSYVLHGTRYETDVEYHFRLEKEAKDKKYREEKEKLEYNRLKAKFKNDD